MKFGLVYPSSSNYVDVDLLKATAKELDDSGFDYFFVWDHYMLPKSEKLPWSNRTLEAFQALSFVAAITEKIKLSTIVTPIPFRNIRFLAKITSFLDFLSKGRFILGAGLGWNETEFRYYSEWKPASERYKITEEGLRTLQAMWAGSPQNVVLPELEPRPDSGSLIPIWFGTRGRKMLKLCAEIGSGWIPSGGTIEEYQRDADKLKAMLKDFGRESTPSNFTFAIGLEDQQLHKKSADDLAKRVESYEKVGANLACQTWEYDPLDRKAFLDKIKWYSKEVIGSFQ
ncbi:MAG: LLM class flavin-dependent oxidoreductase [Nitrososphaerales archaeon]